MMFVNAQSGAPLVQANEATAYADVANAEEAAQPIIHCGFEEGRRGVELQTLQCGI
jgi:hypothetical protein